MKYPPPRWRASSTLLHRLH